MIDPFFLLLAIHGSLTLYIIEPITSYDLVMPVLPNPDIIRQNLVLGYLFLSLIYIPVTSNQEPTETSKQPIRTSYLGHVTGYQPIMDLYFLIRPVHASNIHQLTIIYLLDRLWIHCFV
eukprot:sb/3476343/